MSIRGLLFAAAIVVSAGLLAVFWYTQQPSQLAARYQAELADASDAEVEPIVHRFTELGDAGLRALVESLSSQREIVQQSARRALLDEVDRWQLLPQATIDARLATLANDLATLAPTMNRVNQRFAADLAMRLLLWPRAENDRACPWLSDCEAVLACAVEPKTKPRVAADNSLASTQINTASYSQDVGSTATTELRDSLADEVRLPGGALPLEPSPIAEPGGFVEPPKRLSIPAVDPREPGRLRFPQDARSLNGDNGDDDDGQNGADGDSHGGANRAGRLPSSRGGMRSTALGLLARRQSLGEPMPDDSAGWQKLQPRDVMRSLHDPDPQIVLAARVELARRGITGALVDVARQATDPDPNVRRQFAESLPSLPGVDAKPWLMQLSYDDDPQVRATAVTLMATSGDLEMTHRLEQIAQDDPDDYVRAQAGKAVAPRRRN